MILYIRRITKTFFCRKDIHYRITLISVILCIMVFNLVPLIIQALKNGEII